MSSENSQGYLWIPCEFYSSLANQIMCNKQRALELVFIVNVKQYSLNSHINTNFVKCENDNEKKRNSDIIWKIIKRIC